MANSPQDARYAPPLARVDDVQPPAEGLPLASRSLRFWAMVLDAVAAVAVLWTISKLTSFDVWQARGASIWSISLREVVLSPVIFVLLHGYLLAKRGQTVGKALLGLRITGVCGEAVPLSRLGLRYGVGCLTGVMAGLALIYALIDGLMVFRKSRRCLHDVIAGTVVVKI